MKRNERKYERIELKGQIYEINNTYKSTPSGKLKHRPGDGIMRIKITRVEGQYRN